MRLPPTEAPRDTRRATDSGGWLRVVLRDVQFWIPVAVLLAGLFVLRWVH
jgi:hypothetical protein